MPTMPGLCFIGRPRFSTNRTTVAFCPFWPKAEFGQYDGVKDHTTDYVADDCLSPKEAALLRMSSCSLRAVFRIQRLM